MELALSRLLSLGCVPNTLALCCRIVEAFSVTAADIPTLRGFDVGANRKFPAPSPFEASVEYVEDMAMRFLDGNLKGKVAAQRSEPAPPEGELEDEAVPVKTVPSIPLHLLSLLDQTEPNKLSRQPKS